MGVIKTSFTFMVGAACGVYATQNYDVPNIKKLAEAALGKAKEVEETYRKPEKTGEHEDLAGSNKDRMSKT